ncbi:hypothetical protein P9112_006860 [Eukaryota sp. TZLM1-RC]
MYIIWSIKTFGETVSFIQRRMELKQYKVTAKEFQEKATYIDEPDINPSQYQGMTSAVAGPGKSDLLFCCKFSYWIDSFKKPQRDKYVFSGTLKINENFGLEL